MPTTEPIYGWPLPVAADPPDGPGQLAALAAAIAGTVAVVRTGTYNPNVTRADGSTSVAHSADGAIWTRVGNLVHIDLGVVVNASVTDVAVHLPFKAAGTAPLLGQNSNFGGTGPTGGDAANWIFTFRTYPNDTKAVWMAASGGWRSVASGASLRLNGSYLATAHADFPTPPDYTIVTP